MSIIGSEPFGVRRGTDCADQAQTEDGRRTTNCSPESTVRVGRAENPPLSYVELGSVLAPDRCGQGRSTGGVEASVDGWVNDFHRVLTDANVEKAALRGASLDGIQAIAHASAYPEQVGALASNITERLSDMSLRSQCSDHGGVDV